MRRGEVWVANLNPTRGQEIGKIRPVVIMQADELLDAGMPMVVVLPLTARLFAGTNRWRVTVPPRDRLLRDSQVIVDQPRTLDRTRLAEGPLTQLKDDEMAAVEEGLKVILGFL